MQKLDAQFPRFPICDYKQAKIVYQYALDAIERAKKFFTINERCSDHINCCFDHCSIYGSMIPFLEDIDSRCKMNKRRIDMFERLLKEISPDHFIKYHRKLLMYIADFYVTQVSLKMKQYVQKHRQNRQEIKNIDIRSAGKEMVSDEQEEMNTKKQLDYEKNVHVMEKINVLTTRSILYFYRFLCTFSEFNVDKSKKIPETVDQLILYPLPKIIKDEEYVQPILLAYMMIGKMHTKFVQFDVKQQQRLWLICEKYHLEIKSYLDRNVEHCEKYFREFHQQLLEFLDLIPVKIESLQLME